MSRFHWIRSIALLSAGPLVMGCSEQDPTGPELGSQESGTVRASIVGPPADVSGAWNWSRVEQLKMSAFVATSVGVVPEGKYTHARCETGGTMDLLQAGTEFQGLAVKTLNACETNGGQSFEQPRGVVFVEGGRIIGGTVFFSFASPTLRPCPYHAVIAEMSGGVAQELRGSGRCVMPGHPQSESPIVIPPPPDGSVVTLSWVAER